MSRITRLALPTAALAVLALGTACTSSTTGAAGPDPAAASEAPASDDPVAWIDGVCGALIPLADLQTAPDIDPSSDPAAALQTLGDFLNDAVESTTEAITGLEAVGPSPVEGGDESVADLTEALTSVRTAFENAATEIEAADPNDPASLAALPAALAPLAEIENIPDPTTGLQDNPELTAAAEQAPNCQELELLGS